MLLFKDSPYYPEHKPGCSVIPPYYLTAYGLAVKQGFRGTEEEWVASLSAVSDWEQTDPEKPDYIKNKPAPLGWVTNEDIDLMFSGGYVGVEDQSAVETPTHMNGFTTPQMFGAVGDGVADDTEAFTQMFSAENVTIVYIPKGNYKISGPVSVPYTIKHIYGDGPKQTGIKLANSTAGFRWNSNTKACYVHIRDLGFSRADDYTELTATAIEGRLANSTFRNIEIEGMGTCMNLQYGSWSLLFDSVFLHDSKNGIIGGGAYVTAGGTGSFNDIKFYNCQFQRLTGSSSDETPGAVLYVRSLGESILFDGCDFEFNRQCFLLCRCPNFKCTNTYFENNESILYLKNSHSGGSYLIDNCWILAYASTMAEKGLTLGNGWLSAIEAQRNGAPGTSSTAEVVIKGCTIKNTMAYKLVKFVPTKSTVNGSEVTNTAIWAGVSFIGNYFDADREFCYFDLFDLTLDGTDGTAKYANFYAPAVPITSDIPMYRCSNLLFYREKRGHRKILATEEYANGNPTSRNTSIVHAIGYINKLSELGDIVSHNATLNMLYVNIHGAVGSYNTTCAGTVTVMYTDGAIALKRLDIAHNCIVIRGVDDISTISRIVFDVHYDQYDGYADINV